MERNSRELPPLESLITKTEFERAKEDLWAELTRLDSAVAMVGNFYQLTYNPHSVHKKRTKKIRKVIMTKDNTDK
jgi:hypothetical protein